MKRIVVTGANRGIGFEICSQLAKQGHEVILTARNGNKGAEAAKVLREKGYQCIFMMLDVEQKESIDTFVSQFQRTHDYLDVLINNAAILEDSRYHVADLPHELLDRMLQINVQGPFLLTQKLLPALRDASNPRVINISSGMGALNEISGGYPAYRITKAALNSFTKILASEESRIKVNSVCPGWVKTDMGGSGASRSVEKGAETPVWLATADQIPTGKFLRDKKEINW